MAERERIVGKVEKFFQKPSVAAVRVENGELKVGDLIRIHGATTNFTQTVDSMQIEHDPVTAAKPPDLVGIKTKERVRHGDTVSIIEEEG